MFISEVQSFKGEIVLRMLATRYEWFKFDLLPLTLHIFYIGCTVVCMIDCLFFGLTVGLFVSLSSQMKLKGFMI